MPLDVRQALDRRPVRLDVVHELDHVEDRRFPAKGFREREHEAGLIASLTGKPAGDFSIKVARMPSGIPVMPPGVPSLLLERRPDIAAAERQMAAANEQIGIAEAAFFPDITLSASLGVASTMLGNLFNASNAAWAIGSSVSETVFDAGLRAAQVEQARATYEENVAAYRQTMLNAFQQV